MIKLIFQKKNVYNFSKVKHYFNFFSKDSWYMFQVYANEIDEKTYERKRQSLENQSFIGERKEKQKKIFINPHSQYMKKKHIDHEFIQIQIKKI